MSLAKLQLLHFPKGGGSGRPDKADRVLQPLRPKLARFERRSVAAPVLGQLLDSVTSHTKLALCSGRDQRPLIDVDHLTPALKALALDTIVQKGVETHACECSVQRRLLPRTNWVQYDAGQDFQGEAKRALKILCIYIYIYILSYELTQRSRSQRRLIDCLCVCLSVPLVGRPF